MNLVIVGGGNRPETLQLQESCRTADYILAADSGAQWLQECGIVPDILLGDFDSIPQKVLEEMQANGVTKWVRHRVDKDQTDMELCVEEAIRLCPSCVRVFGATGTRLDHSMANMLLLHAFQQASIEAWIVDSRNSVRIAGCLSKAEGKAGPFQVRLTRQDGFKVSLIAFSPVVSNVITHGLLYDMRGRDLRFGSTLAVSNEFREKEAEIVFQSGLLLVLLSRD